MSTAPPNAHTVEADKKAIIFSEGLIDNDFGINDRYESKNDIHNYPIEGDMGIEIKYNSTSNVNLRIGEGVKEFVAPSWDYLSYPKTTGGGNEHFWVFSCCTCFLWIFVGGHFYLVYTLNSYFVPLYITLGVIYIVHIWEALGCMFTQVAVKIILKRIKIFYSNGFESDTIINNMKKSNNAKQIDRIINSTNMPQYPYEERKNKLRVKWLIECYHIETHTENDKSGSTTTTSKVVTATTRGKLYFKNFVDVSGDMVTYWKQATVEKLMEINNDYFGKKKESPKSTCTPLIVEIIFGKAFRFVDSSAQTRYLVKKQEWKNLKQNKKDKRQSLKEELDYGMKWKDREWLLFGVQNKNEKFRIFSRWFMLLYMISILFGLSFFFRILFRKKYVYFSLKILIAKQVDY